MKIIFLNIIIHIESINQNFFQSTLFFKSNLNSLELKREDHIKFLLEAMDELSTSYQSLDASRPWLCYWTIHALNLLNVELEEKVKDRMADFLSKCQDKNGGFGGGPGQMPHLASTYAAINALVILGTKKAYDLIDRKALLRFYISLKKEGSFQLHRDGEIDMRGLYCVVSCAKLLNILTPELLQGLGDHVAKCQTYEGGICAYPGNEAHGGYAFCGLAALMIINETHKLNLESFAYWCSRRQMSFEGGFQGRTNKLVDSCYSFWMGGCFPLSHALLLAEKDELTESEYKTFEYVGWTPKKEFKIIKDSEKSSLKTHDKFPQVDSEFYFDQNALQEYILLCCQHSKGGLVDKPGKSRDFYHTCYALSGLSIAQHNPSGNHSVLGKKENILNEINPIHNICKDKVKQVYEYFKDKSYFE